MTAKNVTIEATSEVTAIFMRRSAKHNALCPSLLNELKAAVLKASPTNSLALISTSDIFCSGLDLDYLNELWLEKSGLETYFEMLHALYIAVYAHPSPTFAVIRKGAFGGGFGLACCSDLILAGRDSRFVLPGDRFGNLARLARPPLATKMNSVDLEATSAIELTWESAHASGICADLIEIPPYSNLKSFTGSLRVESEKRLQKSSQEEFARLCRHIRTLVLESIDPENPPHKLKKISLKLLRLCNF